METLVGGDGRIVDHDGLNMKTAVTKVTGGRMT